MPGDPAWPSPRTLILCFDGTGNFYDSTNTNVVKLFALLKKDNKDEQLTYYQAGIGTYAEPGVMAGMELWIAKLLDQAIAWYLDAHVMGGYEFLMQNYCTGDRICLFGFSRGAYTARALAGMLYKVGLLPKDNIEQIGFAYQTFQSTVKNNAELAAGFKETFCQTVEVEFLGCWDTVSSVGIFWGRHLPFTSSSTSTKRFRQALSLDEHRAKFQPNVWHREAPDEPSSRLDPEQGSYYPKSKTKKPVKFKFETKGTKIIPKKIKTTQSLPGPSGTDNNIPPEQSTTDVLEVWFAGCHTDIGGGELPSDERRSLSNITLRWMVREIIASQCGIQFNDKALEEFGISPADGDILAFLEHPKSSASARGDSPPAMSDDALDAVQPIHDQLKLAPAWWILEVIPLFISWQDANGKWHRSFRWNLGRGRTIDSTSMPNLHITVRTRMQDKSLAYVPRAIWAQKPDANWVT